MQSGSGLMAWEQDICSALWVSAAAGQGCLFLEQLRWGELYKTLFNSIFDHSLWCENVLYFCPPATANIKTSIPLHADDTILLLQTSNESQEVNYSSQENGSSVIRTKRKPLLLANILPCFIQLY